METEVKNTQVDTEEAGKETKKEVKNKFKEQILKLEDEVDRLNDELLRNRAELENFKRRMKDEAIKDRKYASMTLVSDIITPLEYMLKACAVPTDDTKLQNFLVGFKMIASQIVDVLVADGLSEIKALDEQFDANWHYAVGKEESEKAPNTVIEVLETGYKYKERVLRPAKVKISEEKGEENNE